MQGPLDVLKNVLELEKRKDYTDTSVSGGLTNFISFLEKADVTASITQKNVQSLKVFFLSYAGLDYESKRKLIDQLLDWLADDLDKELEIPSSLKNTLTGPRTTRMEQAANQKQDVALYASVRSIRGIGDRNISIFRKMGIERIIDLLRYFPRR